MKRIIILFSLSLIVFAAHAQEESEVNYPPIFKAFKLKTPFEDYKAYPLKSSDFYKLPDIIKVFTFPLTDSIGNTVMKEMHLFFLGDQLIRATAILDDSLDFSYLQESLGEGTAPSLTVQLDKQLIKDIADGKVSFAYTPLWSWSSEEFSFEQKWIYLCDEGSCIKRMCLDYFVVDYQDLLNSILKD